MRIAIPIAGGALAAHFGHCEAFALLDVDTVNKQVITQQLLDAPPHQPGLLPRWLAEQGVNVVIAGGMGQRAQNLFTQAGIQVCAGATGQTPGELAHAYLQGTLTYGANPCDH